MPLQSRRSPWRTRCSSSSDTLCSDSYKPVAVPRRFHSGACRTGSHQSVEVSSPALPSMDCEHMPFGFDQRAPLRSECPQGIVVRNRLAFGVQWLNTYVTGTGVEM